MTNDRHRKHNSVDKLSVLKGQAAKNYSIGMENYDEQRSQPLNARFFFQTAYTSLYKMIGPTSPDIVHVDMPVGTGRFLFFLRDKGCQHRMLGIDLSANMLDVCQRRIREREDSIALSFGDAFALPLANDSVDILSSLRFFHLFPPKYWPQILAEMRRVIRPGGFLIAEMRNLFRFGAWGLVKEYRDRWLHNDHPHGFVSPLNVNSLFTGWDVVEKRGMGLDGMAQLSAITPVLAAEISGLGRYSLLKYLTKELVVKAVKT